MSTTFESKIIGTNLSPKLLFLIDGIGALVSAFSLGVVLVHFNKYIGMPINTLYFLAVLPVFFAIYDFIVYFKKPANWRPFLKIIAFVNLGYCLISIDLLVQHFTKLTKLGVLYFVLELMIVIPLALFELKIANKKNYYPSTIKNN